MRYSYEYKLECIELFLKGVWPKTPTGIKDKNFHRAVRNWARIQEQCGSEALRHTRLNKAWTPEEKYELVAKVMAGNSILSVAISAGISDGQLYNWVRKYNDLGYNGLIGKKKGRPRKDKTMSIKKTDSKPLNESEREELIRLRAENEYMKAEIAVAKKEMALRHERWAAQLKAKKQQSSENSEKKDIR
ncbi:MAG: transposase [Clostridia bacterium]|nr:transposase [Clostridia bacterium]